MKGLRLLPTKPVCLAVALLLTVPAGMEGKAWFSPKWEQVAQTAPPAKSGEKGPNSEAQGSTLPPVPKPAPASRKDLAAAFTKTAPTSIAELQVIEQHVEALIKRVSPSVVAVELGYGNVTDGTGSGVIISADGLVLTAGHVCGRPNRKVRIRLLDGKTVQGKTLGVDSETDTGLIRITEPGPWPPVPTGELQHAQTGDWVLALGHPGGFDPKRSLVVRLGRIIRLAPAALQTDCTISPGDSGGPLFDMHGRVIGIHSAISVSMAENFHVPISEFYGSWDQLVQKEKMVPLRAYVGASGVDDADGCRLSVVDRNGPAFKAALKVGDVVSKVNGRDIKVSAMFDRWVSEAEPGETLSLEVKRGNKILSLEVKLEAQPRSH